MGITERTISLPEKDYNRLHDDTGFTKLDNRLLSSSEFTLSEKVWLMFIRNRRSLLEIYKQIEPDGWFYCIQKYIYEGTNISERTQTNIIKSLVDKGILEVSVRWNKSTPVNYYRINNFAYEEYVQKSNINPQFLREEQNQQVNQESDKVQAAEIAGSKPQKLRAKEELIEKNKSSCFIVPKGTIATSGSLVAIKTIKSREARNPLILVDSSEPPVVAKPEGVKPIFTKTVHKKQPLKCPPITFNIRQIIDYWIEKGLPSHREDSAAFAQAVGYISQAFDGTLFDKFIEQPWHHKSFTVDEIKRCIDNFYIAAFDKDYEPISLRTKQYLQSIRLGTFFYNAYVAEDQHKSQLLKYTAKPKLVSQSKIFSLKDTHENCTKLVKDWYHQEFGGMVLEVSRQQQNAMVLVGRKIEEFLVTHKDKLDMDYGMQINCNRNPQTFLVDQLLRCASKRLRENDGLRAIFKPSWLISENMLSDHFVYFLRSERILK